MKKLTKYFIAMLTVLVLTACSSGAGDDTADGLQAIKDRGVLRVGVKDDVPGFGLLNTSTSEIEGFEIDIVKALAEELLGDETKYELTAVTAKTRGPLLDNGDIDLVIATFTINEERKLTYNFSTAYYTDSVGFLVKTAAGFSSIEDLANKTIGVAQTATTKDAIIAEGDQYGITFEFVELATYPELKTALDSGRIDAFSVDRSILSGYLDASTEILPDSFSPQEYGVASKLDNTDLSEWVDTKINAMLDDGTLDTLRDAWGLAE